MKRIATIMAATGLSALYDVLKRRGRLTPAYVARLDTLDSRLAHRDEVVNLLRRGQKIEAIRVYRRATGASLLDAKTAVDRLATTGAS